LKTVSLQHIQQVKDTATCLHDANAVNAAYDQMALQISEALSETNPLVISLMNGGLIASGHLLTRLDFILQVDFVHVSRYREKTTGGDILNWLVEPHQDLADRVVLLVDDILDEGKTMYEVIQYCNSKGAAAVYSAVLVNKNHDRREPVDFRADFVGLEIDDYYAYGCGMDYRGHLRNASGIYAVAEELLK